MLELVQDLGGWTPRKAFKAMCTYASFFLVLCDKLKIMFRGSIKNDRNEKVDIDNEV